MEEQIWLNAAQVVLTQIGIGAGLYYMDGVGAGLHYMDIKWVILEKLETKRPLLISI